MVSYSKEKASPKGQKIQKTDLPGPGTHKEMDLAFKLTKPATLTMKFKKDKRKGFAETSAEAKKLVPSPDKYAIENVKDKLIYKRVTAKRH